MKENSQNLILFVNNRAKQKHNWSYFKAFQDFYVFYQKNKNTL